MAIRVSSDALPKHIEYIEREVGVSVAVISAGPRRKHYPFGYLLGHAVGGRLAVKPRAEVLKRSPAHGNTGFFGCAPKHIEYIEREVGVSVAGISAGPGREENIIRSDIF